MLVPDKKQIAGQLFETKIQEDSGAGPTTNRRGSGDRRRKSDEPSFCLSAVISIIALNFLTNLAMCLLARGVHRRSRTFMDTISAMAASGLRSRMQELDMLANNLANSGTGGFKLDREFYSLFSAADNDVDGEASPSTMPMIRKQWTDFSQGTLAPTGNPLDLAISGNGFFVASGPNGNLYTRNGSFKVSNDGTLTTQDGYPVLATDGTQIQLPNQSPVTVATDGTVSQSGQSIAQLQLVDFADRMTLKKMANSYFQPAPKQDPTPATEAEVQQGRIEGSNVAPAESAVRLVGVMRQFEMLQKAISVTADMDKKSLDEVARVASGA